MTAVATENDADRLTYDEAAKLINRGRSAIDRAIALGKLRTHKFPGDPHRYVYRQDVLTWRDHLWSSMPPLPPPPPAPPVAVREGLADGPTTSAVRSLLEMVNTGFAAISDNNERIAQHYSATVAPIIQHTLAPNDMVTVQDIASMAQRMINNTIVLLRSSDHPLPDVDQVVTALLDGLTVPATVQRIITEGARQIAATTTGTPQR